MASCVPAWPAETDWEVTRSGPPGWVTRSENSRDADPWPAYTSWNSRAASARLVQAGVRTSGGTRSSEGNNFPRIRSVDLRAESACTHDDGHQPQD